MEWGRKGSLLLFFTLLLSFYSYPRYPLLNEKAKTCQCFGVVAAPNAQNLELVFSHFWCSQTPGKINWTDLKKDQWSWSCNFTKISFHKIKAVRKFDYGLKLRLWVGLQFQKYHLSSQWEIPNILVNSFFNSRTCALYSLASYLVTLFP
jgi:hypothetical protein